MSSATITSIKLSELLFCATALARADLIPVTTTSSTASSFESSTACAETVKGTVNKRLNAMVNNCLKLNLYMFIMFWFPPKKI